MNTYRSLQASIFDAIFFSIMFGLGESYISAYAVHLEVSPFQIGMLSSVPLLVGAFAQLIGVYLMDKGVSRKSLILVAAFLQACLWLPISALGLIEISSSLTGTLLLMLVCLYFTLGYIIVPVWTSLMGDLVPPEIRGSYFGRRSMFASVSLFVSMLLAGSFLEFGTTFFKTTYIFIFLFVTAAAARFVSLVFLSQHEDLIYVYDRRDYFSLWQFFRKIHRSNFGKFVLFHSAIHFAVFVAAPFFVIYMLEELKFSFFEYTLIISATLLANITMMQLWGKFGDRFGNKRILAICGTGIITAPVLWIFSSNLWYLIIVQIVSGVFWSGYQLGVNNFLLDAVTRPKRGRCTAYLWLPTSICMCAGAAFGGYLLDPEYLPTLRTLSIYSFESKYLCLFVFSGILRAAVVLVFLPLFKEVREVETLPLFFRLPHVHTVSGAALRVTVANFRGRKNLLRNRHRRRQQLISDYHEIIDDLPDDATDESHTQEDTIFEQVSQD